MDNANLMFHEAGHILLGFMGVISGTVMQLLIPVACGVNFARKSEWFSTAICGFWVGENVFNVSVYVADAQKQLLPLVGGGEHDWAILLSRWGVIRWTDLIGAGVFWLAVLIMLASWGWMGFLTLGQWKKKEALLLR